MFYIEPRDLITIIMGESLEHLFRTSGECNCVICLDDEDKFECYVKLKCNHFFHIECLHEWICEQNTCPLCRAEIIDKNIIYQLQHMNSSNSVTEENTPRHGFFYRLFCCG